LNTMPRWKRGATSERDHAGDSQAAEYDNAWVGGTGREGREERSGRQEAAGLRSRVPRRKRKPLLRAKRERKRGRERKRVRKGLSYSRLAQAAPLLYQRREEGSSGSRAEGEIRLEFKRAFITGRTS